MRFKVVAKAVVAGIILGASSVVNAVSLSGAVVKSYIDEPLIIEAEVVGGGEIKLAEPMDYLQYDHEIFHYDLYLEFMNRGNNKILKLTTDQPVTDPSFILLLRTKSAMNEPKILELPIILDFRTGEDVAEEFDSQEKEVLEDLQSIQREIQQAEKLPDAAPIETESTPAEKEVETATEPVIETSIKEQQSEPEKSIDVFEVESQYGPVKKGENLWGIANRVKPKNVSVEQMIVVLKKANAKKLANEDLLEVGIMLSIPKVKGGEFVIANNDAKASILPDEEIVDKSVDEEETDLADLVDIEETDLVDETDLDSEISQDELNIIIDDIESDAQVDQNSSDDVKLNEIRPEEVEVEEEVLAANAEIKRFEEEARLAEEKRIVEEERLAKEEIRVKEERLEEEALLAKQAKENEALRLEEEAKLALNTDKVEKPGLVDLLLGRYLFALIFVVALLLIGLVGIIFYRRSHAEFERGQAFDDEKVLVEKRNLIKSSANGDHDSVPTQTAGGHYSQELTGDDTSTTEEYERPRVETSAEESKDLDFDFTDFEGIDDVTDTSKSDDSDKSPVKSKDELLSFDDGISLEVGSHDNVDEELQKRNAVTKVTEAKPNDGVMSFDLDKLTTELTPNDVDVNVKPVEEVDLNKAMEEIKSDMEVVPDKDFSYDSVETGEDFSISDEPHESEKIKLELAEAYIDFEKELAEPLLKEVLEDGSEEQKAKARELLERIR